MYKHQPCAYCGSKATSREYGHIIPKCMYPNISVLRIQRPTVPECSECKKLWQVAEVEFRNVMVLAGAQNALVKEKWEGPIRRSFSKVDGRSVALSLKSKLVEVMTADGSRHKIYPANSENVMLVIRKIIRGLCHYHKLGTAISDNRVWADIFIYSIPPDLEKEMSWHDVGPELLKYAYYDYTKKDTTDDNRSIHSGWFLKFHEQCEFIGIIHCG